MGMRAQPGLLITGALMAMAACGSEPGGEVRAGADSSVEQLVRIDWGMDAITVGGDRREIDPTYEAVLRFDGEGEFTGKTCNFYGGSVEVTDGGLDWGGDVSMTSMGCQDENLTTLESEVSMLVAADATWSINDERLRIESGDIVLELSRLADAFPTPDLVQIAASAPESGAQWQIGYSAEGGLAFLSWEGRERPGTAFGSAGLAVDPSAPIDGMALSFADQTVVLGYVPPGSDSAAYEVDGADPIPLALHPLPGGRLAVGDLVAEGAGAIVARDVAGTELGRTRLLPGAP